MLAATILGLLATRSAAIRSDFALIAPARHLRAANWLSGRTAGDAMTYRTEPMGRITGGWALAPGIYRRPDRQSMPGEINWHALAILAFFDKLELRAGGAAR